MTHAGVWKLFKVKESDCSKAICNECKAEISRGSTVAKFQTTSAMRKHIETRHKHLSLHLEQDKVEQGFKQLTLVQILEKKSEWATNSSKADIIHKAVGTIMAKDLQPFSIVEDEGFVRLVVASSPFWNHDTNCPAGNSFLKRSSLNCMMTPVQPF